MFYITNKRSIVSKRGDMNQEDKKNKMTDENAEIPVSIENNSGGKETGKQTDEPSAETGDNGDSGSGVTADQLLRLQAEFQNYRKRVERERIQMYDLARGEVTGLLLAVLDDFENLEAHHPEGQVDVEGVRLIHQKLQKILADQGLEKIEALNQPFDPHLHEALGVEETGKDKDGIVVEEWQKGYRFGDRILRHSRVKVGQYKDKGKDKDGDSG